MLKACSSSNTSAKNSQNLQTHNPFFFSENTSPFARRRVVQRSVPIPTNSPAQKTFVFPSSNFTAATDTSKSKKRRPMSAADCLPSPNIVCESSSNLTNALSVYSFREGLTNEIINFPPSHAYNEIEDLATPDELFLEEEEMLDDAEYETMVCEMLSDAEYGKIQTFTQGQQYRAQFPFSSRNSSSMQLSMEKYEKVSVILKHDSEGNPNWWWVVNGTGKQGYVPHNYLEKV